MQAKYTVNDLFSTQCAKESPVFGEYDGGKVPPPSAPIMKLWSFAVFALYLLYRCFYSFRMY